MKVLLCSPAKHSQKPPVDLLINIKNLLDDRIDFTPECLELFARNMRPGWTSWGNEVLKFQDINYFKKQNIVSNSGNNNLLEEIRGRSAATSYKKSRST